MAKVIIILEDLPDGTGFTLETKWTPDLVDPRTTGQGFTPAQRMGSLACIFIHRMNEATGVRCDCEECQAQRTRN